MHTINYRLRLKTVVLVFSLLATSLGWTQERLQSGELKGFTVAPEEHIINNLDAPITVRKVEGIAVFADQGMPIDGMLFELKGPGKSESIVSSTTKNGGRFRLRHTSPGEYLFKATMRGYQSVVGTIIVSPKAASAQLIRIEMKVGV